VGRRLVWAAIMWNLPLLESLGIAMLARVRDSRALIRVYRRFRNHARWNVDSSASEGRRVLIISIAGWSVWNGVRAGDCDGL